MRFAGQGVVAQPKWDTNSFKDEIPRWLNPRTGKLEPINKGGPVHRWPDRGPVGPVHEYPTGPVGPVHEYPTGPVGPVDERLTTMDFWKGLPSSWNRTPGKFETMEIKPGWKPSPPQTMEIKPGWKPSPPQTMEIRY